MQEQAREYGPIYQEHIANFSHVVISDPREYTKVVHADGRQPYRIEMEPMVHYRKKRGLNLGTVNGQGDEWYRHRSVLSRKLLRPIEVQHYIQPMNVVANDFMKRLKRIRDPQQETIPKFEHEVFKWALECKRKTSQLLYDYSHAYYILHLSFQRLERSFSKSESAASTIQFRRRQVLSWKTCSVSSAPCSR